MKNSDYYGLLAFKKIHLQTPIRRTYFCPKGGYEPISVRCFLGSSLKYDPPLFPEWSREIEYLCPNVQHTHELYDHVRFL